MKITINFDRQVATSCSLLKETDALASSEYNSLDCPSDRGRVAQWLRRLPTEQEIPGSSPGVVVLQNLNLIAKFDHSAKHNSIFSRLTNIIIRIGFSSAAELCQFSDCECEVEWSPKYSI